jgi:hypothetical protein
MRRFSAKRPSLTRQVGLEIFETPDIVPFAFLKSISITCPVEPETLALGPDIVMVLVDDLKEGARKLVVRCQGARSIKLQGIDGVGGIYLRVQSIRERGWERLNYHVVDDEQDGAFEWYCRDVQLFLVDP